MRYQKYYFTFGVGHKLRNFVQPIVAPSMQLAMKKMFELYGKNWAMDYTSEEYNHNILNGTIPRKEELETVVL